MFRKLKFQGNEIHFKQKLFKEVEKYQEKLLKFSIY